MTEVSMPRLPSLLARVLLTVGAAVLAVFVLVFGVIVYNDLKRESGEMDSGLLRSAKSIARSLDQVRGEDAARTAVSMLQRMTGEQIDAADEPPLHLVVASRAGDVRLA
ncbi:MAG: hypothetical protein H7Z19_04170, partial [Chitinophagaceae bacterium]|nr:hypothetical protein [Rubrivivax sp.]